MPIGLNGNYSGLLSLCSFGLSVIAAVMAIDMFRLLRTGRTGMSWRVLIIASVIYALIQALRMGEFLDWKGINIYALSQIVELIFALALAYAFYLQRKAFTDASTLRGKNNNGAVYEEEEESDDSIGRAHDADWSRLGDMHTRGEADVIRPLTPFTADAKQLQDDQLTAPLESERR